MPRFNLGKHLTFASSKWKVPPSGLFGNARNNSHQLCVVSQPPTVATVLTLIFLPTLYVTRFSWRESRTGEPPRLRAYNQKEPKAVPSVMTTASAITAPTMATIKMSR